MRLPVRWSAALMVAGAFTFAACGSESTEAPITPDASQGNLEYVVTPSAVSWDKAPADPIPTTTRTVLIGGVIAAGGYPSFGAPQYSGGATGWFEMSTTPNFSRDPLGWRFTFRLRPSAQSLPIGSYTAQIPVNVPAARNNPQMITVSFTNCGNCLLPGIQSAGSLTGASPIFGGGNDPATNPGGFKYYQAFRLFLDPGQSTYIRNLGATGGYGTLNDPYLYVWQEPASVGTFLGSNDDSCGTLNSSIFVQNSSGTRQSYLVYSSHFSSLRTGTTVLWLSNSACGTPPGGTPGVLRDAGDASLEAALQAQYNAKHGIRQ